MKNSIILVFIIMPIFLFILYKIIQYKVKVDINNYELKDNMNCPKCGNKVNLIRMEIFDKSQYECEICGWNKYWWEKK